MKKPKQPSYMTLAILTVITVFFWIIFSVLRLLQKPVETKVPSEILEPISPTLDLETLDSLRSSEYYSDVEIGGGQIVLPSPEIEIEEEETPVATEPGIPLEQVLEEL